jgi:hypothetical protein
MKQSSNKPGKENSTYAIAITFLDSNVCTFYSYPHMDRKGNKGRERLIFLVEKKWSHKIKSAALMKIKPEKNLLKRWYRDNESNELKLTEYVL